MRILLLWSLLFVGSCAQRITTIEEDKDLYLDEDMGYMLIAVDTNYTLEEMRINGTYINQLVLTMKDMFSGTNYVLIDVPAGEYEIYRIKFFGRRYTDLEKEYWSFNVEPNVISYVGDVFVRQKGWSSSNVKLELQNNSSRAMEFMEDNYPNILESRRMTYQGPGVDKFFNYVEALKNKKTGK